MYFFNQNNNRKNEGVRSHNPHEFTWQPEGVGGGVSIISINSSSSGCVNSEPPNERMKGERNEKKKFWRVRWRRKKSKQTNIHLLSFFLRFNTKLFAFATSRKTF